eukprot:gene34039-41199_t
MEEDKEVRPGKAAGQVLSEEELIEKVAAIKQYYDQLSQELFNKQQEFLHLHESLRIAKQTYQTDLEESVQRTVKMAKAEAYCRYLKEDMAQKDMERKNTITSKQKAIVKQRESLQQALLQYRLLRSKIRDIQGEVIAEGESKRKLAARQVEILTGTKYVLESQMRRPSQRKTFPTKKELQRSQRQLLEALAEASQQLRAFHSAKIMAFRMQERILVGRCKEALERTGGRGAASEELPANFLPPSERDTLESRIAAKMFTVPSTMPADHYSDSDNEEAGALPALQGDKAAGGAAAAPSSRPRRFSILQSGEVERLQSKWNNKSTASASSATHANARKLLAGRGEGVVYDADEFSAACSADFIKPHLLLDGHGRVGDKEERLRSLACLLCSAKGKVIQLHAIKEGLDAFLLKHLALLWTALDQLQPALAQHLLGDERRALFKQTGGRPLPGVAAPAPLPALSALHQTLLKDAVAIAQDSQDCQQRIYRGLFGGKPAP